MVDDSPSMRSLVKNILSAKGYEVLTAQDGEKAFKLLRQEKVDLIITDVNMPRMDGIEFTRNVRESDIPSKHVPILVATTEGGEDKKQSGRVVGASGWVVKPFEMDTLLGAVEKLLLK